MRRKLFVCISLGMLLLLAMPGQVSYATPTPLYILVNDTTKQCYVSIMGDECMWCEPPVGWRIYGPGSESYGPTPCPEGYTKIENFELNCRRSKSRECCGVFAARGDCTDMVVNDTLKECAFVKDINACILPPGWSARPTQVLVASWICHSDTYKWVDNVTCLTATGTPAGFLPAAARNPSVLPAAGLGLIALGGGLLAWLIRKR